MPNRADSVGGHILFHHAHNDQRMPALIAAKIPQDAPDLVRGSIDDGAASDLRHVHPQARPPLTSKRLLQGIEAALEYALSNLLDQGIGTIRRTIEVGAPFAECPIAVGHGDKPHRGDIVRNAHWRFEDLIGEGEVIIRQRQEALANTSAVLEREVSNAADLVRRLTQLDSTFLDGRVPAGQAVEISDAVPD